MLTLIGTLYFIYVLMKLYIATMEVGFVRKAMNETPVVLEPSAYVKAGQYKITNERFEMLKTLFEYGLFLVWIGGGLAWLEGILSTGSGILQSTIFVLVFLSVNYILTLPFDLYATFVKDKDFSTIDAKTYILDQIKGALITIIAGGAIIGMVVWIINNLPTWWIWGFVAIFTVVLFINMFYPTYIAPIFNKFSPLEDDSLRVRIEALLEKAGLKSEGVFMVDASKRDKRLNAYFGGLGKSKRVVLYDTLVEKLSQNELLAVLGHELGHFKHKDILKNIFATGVLLAFMFGIFGNLPTGLFEAIGLEASPHSTIALFLLLSPLISFIWMPIFGYMSRANEYKADEYGSASQSKESLRSALMKLADANSSFPLSHPLSIIFYHTHPPLIERLKRLE
jgi:STE24 endopeptidase